MRSLRLPLPALSAAAALALCFTGLPAQAQNINFEDVAVGAGVNDIGGDRTSTGFNFDSTTNHTHLTRDTFGVSNGTTYLVLDDFFGTNPTTMSKVGGGTFSLTSLDIAEWIGLTDAATTVDVTGNLFGGGTITQTITLDLVFDGVGGAADFQTATFGAGWGNLTSVVFQGFGSPNGNNYYSLDNIQVGPAVVGAVPEFGTVASLGALLSLGGLGLVRARRRRNA